MTPLRADLRRGLLAQEMRAAKGTRCHQPGLETRLYKAVSGL